MKNKPGDPHETQMKKCIALAMIAKQRGDSAVGSVVVKDNIIVGEGIEGGKTHKDITYHAEIEAIRQASRLLGTQDLSGCVMYTTHEPCIMCSYVIRHSRISRIIMGVTTGDTGGYSSQMPLLINGDIKRWGDPPEIITGVLENECHEL